MAKELRIYVINLDNAHELEEEREYEITPNMPIETFVEIAEEIGDVYSIGGFARTINNTLDNEDNFSNSYIRFAWVNGNDVTEETGMVVR